MAEKLKILIVDDNEEFCSNLTDILELKDYTVATAYDGFRGLELAGQDNFDLVLMDVKMPVMNGVETFRKMKEVSPDTPVIMMTAFAVEELIREALQEGAYGSMKKPLDFDHLFELIENATGTGAMILITDDDEDLCTNMQEILMQKGYRVSVAYDGESAIARTKQNYFDIMLLDLKLPRLNGLETYLRIKEIRPDIVAIVITGYRDEEDELIKKALEEKVYSCMEKPIDINKLLMLLDTISNTS